MSIKDNIKQIQEEFKGDEKILESAFKLERFYNKYKYILFAIIIALLVWFLYYQFSIYQENKKAQNITQIYNQLLKDPNNQALLDNLKSKSKDLYDLYRYTQAMKNADVKELKEIIDSRGSMDKKNPDIIKILAEYQYASYLKNPQALQAMTDTGMKDFSILQEAYLLQQNGKIQEAQNLLNQISASSSTFQIANLLKHYGVKDFSSIEKIKNNLNKESTNNEDKSDKK
ncbi:hypothetical protein [Helicobacter cappadocius]|uniref:50S ribosomal protein L22 n=1 Tax=Helicobacter cappadocius TaxID=3063998 RepID=A0AA90TFJ9_9HELI|nr:MULTISPECIES: hypothetical protein [unclassified Helicobacter]MDO7253831.1 hypothetical protein [Helicobacter sp. faydin-H75]MDP2539720.1 hypothetical protein [Helicobacter sp. faydin-H76]